MFASAAIHAHAAMGGRKAQGLPLVLSAPLDAADGSCLVAGVPPVASTGERRVGEGGSGNG